MHTQGISKKDDRAMLVDVLLLLLLMSFTIHLLILVFYLLNKKNNKLFIWFISTSFSNIIIGMILTVVALKNPDRIRKMNLDFIFWVLSGFISLFMLGVKAYFFRKIYLRRKDPTSYHLNYFGKKVYSVDTVKYYEIAVLILSMPFFLIFGAYFIAKLSAMNF